MLLVYPPGAESRGRADALSELHATVDRADHIFQAISRFTAHPADVVVLGLADIDDRDLGRAIPLLRELRPGVFILLAYPLSRRESAIKALGLGADGYIPEPCYLSEFKDLVHRGIQRSRSAPETTVGLGDQELEKLAGAIGHAVGNPLQIIEFQLAQEEIEADEIRHETARIASVAEELLAYARRTEINPGTADINRILKEVVKLTGDRRRRFERNLAAKLPTVAGDATRLTLAFRALAAMAGARGPDGRLIVNSARDGADRVSVAFRAPELLLSPEEQRSFFRPFSGPLQGEVGLRAAAAEGIILSHRGEITLVSREGEGTTITVRLPVRAAVTPRSAEKGAGTKGE